MAFEELFGDAASGSEELAPQPPPARRPRLAPRPLAAAAASPSLPVGLDPGDAADDIIGQVFAPLKGDPSLKVRVLAHVATLWAMYCFSDK